MSICLLLGWTQIQSSILLVQAQIGIHELGGMLSMLVREII